MKFQTRPCMAYWPMGSLLPRPREILPSLFQCRLSRVALHLFQASGKPERQGGIALGFWCSGSGTGCQGLHSSKGQEAHRQFCFPLLSKTDVGWQESLALALSQQMSPFSQCKHLKTPLCSKKITLPLTAGSHSKETWGVTKPNLSPALTNRSTDFFAGYHCENTASIFTKTKRNFLTFKYSIRKAEAHLLHFGSCPMCPDCYHTSAKLPTLEWLFQPWRGLLWKELEESLWLLSYVNYEKHSGAFTVKSTSWLWRTRANVVNSLIIPEWHSQECTWKGRKAHAKHQ